MPTQRRRKGDGSLYKRADGMWIGAVSLGYGPDGKPRRKVVSSKSLPTAQKKLRDLQRQVAASGGTVPTASMTVKAWLEQWLTNAQVKPTTLANYRQTVRLYLIPALGKHRLDRLTRQHVRDLRRWMEQPTDTRAALSQSTVYRAHRVLNAALNDAVREGIVTANVAALVKTKQPSEGDRTTLDVPSATRLLTSTDDPMTAARWACALLLGQRQGEVLGMEWSRIDLERGVLDLSWQLQRLPYRHGCGGHCGRKRAGSCPQAELDVPPGFDHRRLEGGLALTRPKSAAGTRVIPLLTPVVAALSRVPRSGPHGLVFTREDGRPIDPSDDNAAWHRALDAAGLPSVPLHVARHTAASMMLAAGVDAYVIQAILGHSTVAMTRAYQHVDLTLERRGLGAYYRMLGLEA